MAPQAGPVVPAPDAPRLGSSGTALPPLPSPKTFFPNANVSSSLGLAPAQPAPLAQTPPLLPPTPPAPVTPAPLPLLAVTPMSPLAPLPPAPPALPYDPLSQPAPRPAPPRDDHSWETVPDKFGTDDGWSPSTGSSRQQSQASPLDPAWESARAISLATPSLPLAPLKVRAQVGDRPSNPDPTIGLIFNLLQGKADAVEVRWTGSRRLAVCFEVPSEREGGLLVRAISSRQELAPFQIDFCVFVK
jgi:hypothetical protein